MTKNAAASLLPLAKSWIYPPELKLSGSEFISEGYNFRERAYVVNCEKGGSNFKCKLMASQESPLVNPAFVLKNWGDSGAKLKIDGRKIKRGRNFRFGHRQNLEGTDLIVWLKTKSTQTVEIVLSHAMI
jgi:hypothetical protein